MGSVNKLETVEKMAKRIRCHVVTMTARAKAGHPGGSLSCTDILTVLYFDKMNIDPAKPDWAERDRLVLSKGHAAPALYAALAERGYFPVEELMTLRQINSRLQGHPDMLKTPGVDISTGSLGQGLSMANGMAIAGKLDKKKYKVYAILGDGECQEGQVWEAAMAAAHYKLDNVIAFVDRNQLQIDGSTKEIMGLEPFADKWKAFGWDVQIIDGHSLAEIGTAVDKARKGKGKPHMIIANTVKGKGVSFMECNLHFHGNAPDEGELKRALEELK